MSRLVGSRGGRLECLSMVSQILGLTGVALCQPPGTTRCGRTSTRRTGWLGTGPAPRRVALDEVMRLAESEEILITRHGKPAGVPIGFEGAEEWVDDRLEHHPEVRRRIAAALRSGRGAPLQAVPS